MKPSLGLAGKRIMDKTKYIDDLISAADDRCYSDFCRLLVIMWWNI